MSTASSCPHCQGTRCIIDRTGERCRARLCACTSSCARCGGSGRLLEEKDGYSFLRPCGCRAIEPRLQRFNQARLPARCGLQFEDFLPRNDEQQKALAVAMTTAMRYRPDAPSKGFIVAGPVGTGKTHLLCATLRHLTLELGVSARYVEISFLFAEIRRGYNERRSELEAIQPLVDTDVLAIDEIGKGRGTPFELDMLDELIARRYNANRTTLFATNYLVVAPEKPRGRGGYLNPIERDMDERSPSETPLKDRVGERIFSRLHEMCHIVQLPPSTPDHRRVGSG